MSVSTDVVAHVIEVERKQATKKTLVTLLVGFFVLLSLLQSGLLNGQRLSEGLPAIGVMIAEMIPPDFTRWREWVSPMIDTLTMSIAGTFLAIFFSLPLAFIAAKNSSPNGFAYQAARMLLNALRSIPELILGIIFVAAVGFGMLPGVLALGLHSIGMVGKFFAEAVEHSHNGPIEAVQAVGGSRTQVITHGILPQVFPKFLDVAMYRWEYNFRASTVMGMVGAGGIGTELVGSLRLIDYPQVAAILLVILAAVTAVDALSNYARSKLS